MWWAVYVFSVAASGRAANWSLLGAALLSLLFLGSVRLTEGISLKKVGYREAWAL